MLLSSRRATAAFSALFLSFLPTPAVAQDSYTDPAGSGVMVSAVHWLPGTLLGTFATVVAGIIPFKLGAAASFFQDKVVDGASQMVGFGKIPKTCS